VAAASEADALAKAAKQRNIDPSRIKLKRHVHARTQADVVLMCVRVQ
jgi:hypothetical protein